MYQWGGDEVLSLIKFTNKTGGGGGGQHVTGKKVNTPKYMTTGFKDSFLRNILIGIISVF
jgi:hypothetical protein